VVLSNPPDSAFDPDIVWTNTKFNFANKTTILRAHLAYYQAVADEQKGFYTGKSSVSVPHNLITPLTASYITEGRRAFTLNEAKFALLKTEVALRRYRFANGKYPNSLTELKPKYLSSETIDPFGRGKQLCYKPLNGGKDFLLYSIGPNLVDDKGTPGKRKGGFKTGDIVAGKCY
jgi:hypothetical protein